MLRCSTRRARIGFNTRRVSHAPPTAIAVMMAGCERVYTDYLVVGAGAMGMAFTDALIDHADVHVTLVDRRYAPAGTGRTPIRSCSSTRRRCSTAWRRPCSAPARCNAGAGGRTPAAGATLRDPGVLRRRCCTAGSSARVGSPSSRPRVPHRGRRPRRHVAGVGREGAGRRAPSRSSTPRTCRRRSRRRHRRRSASPTARASSRSTSCPRGRHAERVRDRRLGQDGD